MDGCFTGFVFLCAIAALVLAAHARGRGAQATQALDEVRRLKELLEEVQARLSLLEAGEAARSGPAPLQQGAAASAPTDGPGLPAIPEAAPPPESLPAGIQTTPLPAVPVLPPPLPEPLSPAAKARPLSPEPVASPVPNPAPVFSRLEAAPPLPRMKAEEFLATRFFLRVGVAVLVLGVLFILGLVFQRMGPAGKLLMAYGAAGVFLAGGLRLEARETYRTIGRAFLAGGWALIFVVTFAAGFLEASRVIQGREVAVLALFLAASTCVVFSLRYRHEMTTTGAFLLIQLSLGMAGHYLAAPFSLVAAGVVALAVALLALRVRWHRLLGLGALATWINLALCMSRAPLKGGASLAGLAVVGLIFLAALVLGIREEEQRPTPAFTVLGLGSTFLGLLALGILTSPPGWAPHWCGGLGLLWILCAAWFRHQGRQSLYLFAGTSGLVALGLVTPLRLGLRHHLAPVLRALGLEVLLAAGVTLKERYWRRLAYAGLALTALDALARSAVTFGQARLVLLASVALACLATAGLARGPWRHEMAQDGAYVPPAFTWAGTLFLGLFLWFLVPVFWVPLALVLLALLWLGVGTRRGLSDLALQGLALGAVGVFLVVFRDHPQGITRLDHGLGIAVWGCLLLAYVLQCAWSTLEASLDAALAGLLSGLTVFLGVFLTFAWMPAPWGAPSLALLGALLMEAGHRWRRAELRWESLVLVPVAAVGALLTVGADGTLDRAWALGLVAALQLIQALRLLGWSEDRFQWAQPLHSLVPSLLLLVMVFRDLPPWMAPPVLAGLALVWTLWSLWIPLRLHALEGLGFGLLSLLALMVRAGSQPALRGLLEVLGTLALLYGLQEIWRRLAVREDWLREDELLTPVRRLALARFLLPLLAIVLGWNVKTEALGGLNAGVAPLWGGLALLHLERGRVLKDRAWLLVAHGGLLAAMVHFIGVNLATEEVWGGIPVALLTGVPFLGMLFFAYRATPHPEEGMGTADRLARGRAWYLYGGLLILALLLQHELPRAWVLPAWAILAAAALTGGRAWGEDHGTRAGALLALAALVQGLAFNLVQRDILLGVRLNLISIPAAVLAFLAGYLQLWRDRSGEGDEALRGFAAGRNRFLWLACALVLLFGFLWVEMDGTLLTILLSCFGLGVVGLGFACKERVARLAGIGILLFCILKLFLFDLRGLTGLPRALSLVGLGAVLVSVSLVYARFRARREDVA